MDFPLIKAYSTSRTQGLKYIASKMLEWCEISNKDLTTHCLMKSRKIRFENAKLQCKDDRK